MFESLGSQIHFSGSDYPEILVWSDEESKRGTENARDPSHLVGLLGGNNNTIFSFIGLYNLETIFLFLSLSHHGWTKGNQVGVF